MPRFPGDFQHETIREPQARPPTKTLDRRDNCLRILQCQVLVVEKHFDGSGNITWSTVVDRGEHPCCLGEDQMRHPCSTRNERLGRRNLLGIVARDQANQNIRINGAHDVS